jgi:hypothetical protein
MSTNILPKVGDTVKAITVPGMPEYSGKTCVLTEVSGTPDAPYLRGEFQSRQKPDDTINYSFIQWEPVAARIPVGSTVRCTVEAPSNHIGKIGTVTIDDESAIPYYVTGIYADNPESGMWMYEHQVEVVADGETLTVSGSEFKVGDYVEFSAALTDDGIDDSISGTGVIIEAADGIYTVQTGRTRSFVTGTGYVGRWTPAFARMGEKVTMFSQDPAAPTELLGKEGIITGWYSPNSPQVTYPRDVSQYLGHYPGAWVIGQEYLTEGPIVETDVVEAPAIPADLHHSQIERLERELRRANERVEEATTRAGKWERDFMRSWERIATEAVERDWCSEYERVVSDVEDSLEIGTIPPREQEYDVVVNIDARLRIQHTIKVTARSQEDAEEMVSDDIGSWVTDPDGILTNQASRVQFEDIEMQVAD